jgi:hypothetical protein
LPRVTAGGSQCSTCNGGLGRGLFAGTVRAGAGDGAGEGWVRAAWRPLRRPVDEMERAACTGKRESPANQWQTTDRRSAECLLGEGCKQSAGAASPSSPALYWNPTRRFRVALLNCGPSPDRAMSSTYMDSVKGPKIVSNNFWGDG